MGLLSLKQSTLVKAKKNLWAGGRPASEDTCGSWVASGHLESHTVLCMKVVMLSALVHVRAQLQAVSMVRILFSGHQEPSTASSCSKVSLQHLEHREELWPWVSGRCHTVRNLVRKAQFIGHTDWEMEGMDIPALLHTLDLVSHINPDTSKSKTEKRHHHPVLLE